MRLASIHIYPLKGARGISLERSDVFAGGLRHDRRFMVIGPLGAFVTQRTHPKLALVDVALRGSDLVFDGGTAHVPLDDGVYSAHRRVRVKVWDDEVEAVEVPGGASEFLSDHLGEACRLVYMPDDSVRPVEAPHGREGDRVAFADAFPVLVATLASLADLNARLTLRGEAAVPIDRFRPNLVIDGGEPYDEERFAGVTVGGVRLRMPKRCSRCQVITVDQATAEVGREPLRTLSSYRADANKVSFAQNAIPDASGTVSVGDGIVYDTPL